MIFSSFHITEKNIPYYIEELNRFQPQAIDGFFTSICDVASYAERHNMAFTFMPVAIFPTSETVTESGRALLERVFKAKVYNQYASSEGAPFITDCPGQKLHIEMCTGVFEHFKENSNEVLVTSFHTYGTPLIRYRIGDNIVFEDIKMKCSCGLKSPCVQNIEGRSLDFLYTPEGAKIYSVNVANLFKNMPNVVIKSQILQEKINEIVILMEVDKSKYKKTFDDLLKNEVEHKFGKKMNVIIKHVDNIPKAKSGKSQFIINRIAMEQ
jgi:phenylacetate-CoA ligase